MTASSMVNGATPRPKVPKATRPEPASFSCGEFFPVAGENSGEGRVLDLFGQPVLPIKDRRGRPSFKKTAENQDFVAVRAARGWSQKRIAEEMGVDEKTLRKNFSRELHSGLLIVEGMMLDVLMAKVRLGHVPSIRLLLDLVQTTAPRTAKSAEDDDEDAEEVAPPAARLGKKEQRDDEAQNVPSEYGDLYARLRRPS